MDARGRVVVIEGIVWLCVERSSHGVEPTCECGRGRKIRDRPHDCTRVLKSIRAARITRTPRSHGWMDGWWWRERYPQLDMEHRSTTTTRFFYGHGDVVGIPVDHITVKFGHPTIHYAESRAEIRLGLGEQDKTIHRAVVAFLKFPTRLVSRPTISFRLQLEPRS